MAVFDEMLAHFGSENKLAGALDVTTVAVRQWVTAGELPPLRAIQVEKMTNGKFKAIDLITPETN